jgi:hypothetical protein
MSPKSFKIKSILTTAFSFSLIITGANTQSLIISISAYGQPDFPPFEVDYILGPYESTSQVTKNLSEKLGILILILK